MKTCIVAIAKDEGPYLLEWASYHIALGFDRIFLYDNDSSDHPESILAPLLDHVEVISWPTQEGISPQLTAYNNPNIKLRDSYDFAAFIDIDEFITLRHLDNIKDYLETLPETVSAVAINQKIFGSSHLDQYIDTPVTSRFTKCADYDHPEHLWYKSIYRLKNVRQINNCHKGDLLQGDYTDANFSTENVDLDAPGQTKINASEKIHINHYILKSREEFETKKKLRGGGMDTTKEARLERYNNDYFFSYRDSYANNSSDQRIIELMSKFTAENKIYT
ncbi:glycosyltransferase family 2 protein [Pseudomonas sp. CFBP 13719]|uniref:glycosyltransferase family 2 protein n=1 Tax=Pseudomonas sp. CFBP 13719 TaxID=2775303 RepID=UPI0017838FE9|nr:glycosyltransferase family 2 protein [Pseudomonas sp. CFBP 13719]MBD8684811.1 glycosyltransferase family 2 protein [Pseudomonas sp. CFBP 13719]